MPAGAQSGQVPNASGQTLQDGELYWVQAYAVGAGGLNSTCSEVISATPYAIDDFWNEYKNDDGTAAGCGQSPGPVAGLSISFALLAFAASRKRKERR